MTSEIQKSMNFLIRCVGKERSFEYVYTPISMRFIEKSPEFIKKLLNNFLTTKEKNFICKRFGLEDGKIKSSTEEFGEFGFENKAMLKKMEFHILKKIRERILRYLEMCQCEKIEDPFISFVLNEIGIKRFINLYSNVNDFKDINFFFSREKINEILDLDIKDIHISKIPCDALRKVGVTKVIQLLNIIENGKLYCLEDLDNRSKLEIKYRLSVVFPNYNEFICIGKKFDTNPEINKERCYVFFDDIDISALILGEKLENIFKKKNINTVAELLYLYTDVRTFKNNCEVEFENVKFKGMYGNDVLFIKERLSKFVDIILKLKNNKEFFLFSCLLDFGISRFIYLNFKLNMSFEKVAFKYKSVDEKFELDQLGKTSIENLGLSKKTERCLKREGILNVLQLIKVVELNFLKRFRQIGSVAEAEIMSNLSSKFPNFKDFYTGKEYFGFNESKKKEIELYDVVLDSLSIKTLGFENKIYNVLKKSGITSVGDLINSYNNEFINISNLCVDIKENNLKKSLIEFLKI